MKKILVVDDDEDILELVRLILSSDGFDVRTHSTGLHVPEIVDQYHPDLILLDIRLPGKTGTDICSELKKTHSIPIVLFSAHAREKKVFEICKAEAFVSKPFDVKHLLNIIHQYVN